MDNGDDCHDSTEDRYWTRPRQAGLGRATIQVRNDVNTPKTQRWNLSYSLPLSFEMGCASFEDGEYATDFMGQFWDHFWTAIIMLGVMILICVVIALFNPLDIVMDIAYLPILLAEVYVSWQEAQFDYRCIEIGYFETKAWFYKDENKGLRVYYHYIADGDGTLIRIVLNHEEFDPKYVRFTGEKW